MNNTSSQYFNLLHDLFTWIKLHKIRQLCIVYIIHTLTFFLFLLRHVLSSPSQMKHDCTYRPQIKIIILSLCSFSRSVMVKLNVFCHFVSQSQNSYSSWISTAKVIRLDSLQCENKDQTRNLQFHEVGPNLIHDTLKAILTLNESYCQRTSDVKFAF